MGNAECSLFEETTISEPALIDLGACERSGGTLLTNPYDFENAQQVRLQAQAYSS